MTPEQRKRLESWLATWTPQGEHGADVAALLAAHDALAAERDALRAELRQACLCRCKSVDGDIRLRHECDAHKAERLGRNAALEREQKERAAKVQAERTAAALRELLHGGTWLRLEDGRTQLAVEMPPGADLSCRAMRDAAIDAALALKEYA